MFTVNHNADKDVIHVEHPWEACNTDQADDLEQVDAATAIFLIAEGQARSCEHCKPEPA